MDALFQAIFTKVSNDVDHSASLTGGLHLTEAPQDTDYPYAVFSMPSNVPNWTFSENMENCLIQFNIYSDQASSEPISDIYDDLKACFDWCTLTVVGYHHIYMKREFGQLLRVDAVWQYSVRYRVELQES